MTDYSAVLIPGAWSHEFVAANGARFHVAQAGPTDPGARTVVLLHSFPQFWWAWRNQIPVLAEAGYRVIAMDLRGVGASDKPPSGYDIAARTRDVAGVVRAVGAAGAVCVGHGSGGVIAWAMAALQPAVTDGVVAVGAPHPAYLHRTARANLTPMARRHLAFFQLPQLPERAFVERGYVRQLLTEQSPGVFAPSELDAYDVALRVPFAAHNSLEGVRWPVRSALRPAGRRLRLALREPVLVPALQLHGEADRVSRVEGADDDAAAIVRNFRFETLPGVGHHAPEEAPDLVNGLLLEFLAQLP